MWVDVNGFFLFNRRYIGISFLNLDVGMLFILFKIEVISFVLNNLIEFVFLVVVVFKLEYVFEKFLVLFLICYMMVFYVLFMVVIFLFNNVESLVMF